MKRSLLVTVMIVAIFGFGGQALAGKPTDMVKLGEALYTDVNLSLNSNQSCMTCHHPLSGFIDTTNHIDPINSPVSDGSDSTFFGGRNAPSAAYAGFSPTLDCVDDGEGGTFCTGGMFWDGRATGLASTDTGGIVAGGITTGPTFDPLADQAKGPFQNPVEMALTPDEVIAKVRAADYAGLFEKAFGYNVATEPAHIVYNDIGNAILKEYVLAFIFDHTDIAILGVLVMNEILVFPLRFDGILVQFVRLTGQNQKKKGYGARDRQGCFSISSRFPIRRKQCQAGDRIQYS